MIERVSILLVEDNQADVGLTRSATPGRHLDYETIDGPGFFAKQKFPGALD